MTRRAVAGLACAALALAAALHWGDAASALAGLAAGALAALAGRALWRTPSETPPDPPPPPPDTGPGVLGRLSHDLRGTLSPALLAAERLQGHADTRVRTGADTIAAAIDRAIVLVKHQMDAARAAARPALRLRFALHGVVGEAESRARASLGALKVENRVAPHLMLTGDPARLRLVLEMLMQATPATATSLTLRAAPEAAHVCITLASTGGEPPRDAVARAEDLLRAQGGRIVQNAAGLHVTLPLG